MTEANLKDTLLSMVLEHGFEQVDESLREIGLSELYLKQSKQKNRTSIRNRAAKASTGKVKSHSATIRCEDGSSIGEGDIGG